MKNYSPFTRFLRKQWKRDDPVGDLARDAREEGAEEYRTMNDWRSHLRFSGACQGAKDALEQAIEEYKREG